MAPEGTDFDNPMQRSRVRWGWGVMRVCVLNGGNKLHTFSIRLMYCTVCRSFTWSECIVLSCPLLIVPRLMMMRFSLGRDLGESSCLIKCKVADNNTQNL